MTDLRIVVSRKPLDATRIRTTVLGWSSTEVVETTGSTNADPRKQAVLGQVTDLSAPIASEQTAGRGRLSRNQTASKGVFIALSALLCPEGPASEQLGLLPLVAGPVVIDAVVEVAGLAPECVSLKWSNDVLVDGRKPCGILVEAASLTPSTLIPGTGISVSLQENELPVPHAISLYPAGTENFDHDDISVGVLRVLGHRQAQQRKGDAELLRDYGAVRATIGSNVCVELPGDHVLVDKTVGVCVDGELIVTDEAGTSHFVAAGDVFHVRATDGGYAPSQTDSGRRQCCMVSPNDELDTCEAILLDTNPTLGRLVWPPLELMVITGVCWLLIGFIDGPTIASGGLQGMRQLPLFAWPGPILWCVVRPVLSWLGKQFALTDRRIILCRDILRPQVVSIDLRSVCTVNRKDGVLYLQTRNFGPPLVVEDIPSSRKVAKLVSRSIQNFGS